jgi:hypothetical protein
MLDFWRFASADARWIACERLGLERKEIGTGTLLPPSRGAVIVKRTALVSMGGMDRRISEIVQPLDPDGVVGELRGDDVDPTRRLVSFETCGGVVFGMASKRDLVGQPLVGHATTERCPGTGEVYVGPPPPRVSELVTCSRDIQAFVRTATLEDPIGVIKAGARLRRDGSALAGAELITLPDAPVSLIPSAHFAAQASDLKACSSIRSR